MLGIRRKAVDLPSLPSLLGRASRSGALGDEVSRASVLPPPPPTGRALLSNSRNCRVDRVTRRRAFPTPKSPRQFFFVGTKIESHLWVLCTADSTVTLRKHQDKEPGGGEQERRREEKLDNGATTYSTGKKHELDHGSRFISQSASTYNLQYSTIHTLPLILRNV